MPYTVRLVSRGLALTVYTEKPLMPSNRRFSHLALCIVVIAAATARTSRGDSTVDYSRDVLPILSTKCYKCHVPDEGDRQKELRLDTKQGVFRTEEGVTVVGPGKPAKSEMIPRSTARDPGEGMGPSGVNRKLKADQ